MSPGGTFLAAGSGGDSAVPPEIWDVADGQAVALPLPGGVNNSEPAVAFSPDGSVLATGANSGTWLWNIPAVMAGDPAGLPQDLGDGHPALATSRQVSARERTALGIGSLPDGLLSPDGKTAAIAEVYYAQIWNLASKRPVTVPLYGNDRAYELAFSPDGTILAVGGEDGTTLWDLETDEPIGTELQVPDDDGLAGVNFSQNGTTLVTQESGNFSWNAAFLQPAGALGFLCGQVGQSFTRQQWSQYVSGVPYQDTCP